MAQNDKKSAPKKIVDPLKKLGEYVAITPEMRALVTALYQDEIIASLRRELIQSLSTEEFKEAATKRGYRLVKK